MWPSTSGVDGVILLLLALVATPAVPDETLTPGVAVPGMTRERVCATKWGLDRRFVTQRMREAVCARYGLRCIRTVSTLPIIVASATFPTAPSSHNRVRGIEGMATLADEKSRLGNGSNASRTAIADAPSDLAGAAISRTVGLTPSINSIEGMSVQTMSPTRLFSEEAVTAAHVFTMRDYFLVPGVDARWDTTEMIWLQTVGDRPPQERVHQDMSTLLAKSAISTADHSVTHPDPAATHGLELDPLLKGKRQPGDTRGEVRSEEQARVAQTHCTGNPSICAGGVEIDHRIPRELGGADDIRNLWPQPWRQARRKDRLELALHRAVCRGELTLREAQRLIVEDWPGEYRRRFGVAP